MKKSMMAFWTVLLVFTICGSSAYADVLVADIQFPFKAEGQELSAGKYRIDIDIQSGDITLRNESTGKAIFVRSLSRLSERGNETLVVFDKQGDQYYLSEIYLPGIDGFEVRGATGKHTHVKVKGTK